MSVCVSLCLHVCIHLSGVCELRFFPAFWIFLLNEVRDVCYEEAVVHVLLFLCLNKTW